MLTVQVFSFLQGRFRVSTPEQNTYKRNVPRADAQKAGGRSEKAAAGRIESDNRLHLRGG